MKKLFLASCLLFSNMSFAQTAVPKTSVSIREMFGNDSFEQELSVLDMKLFHDREIMQRIVQGLYEVDRNPQNMMAGKINISSAVFSEKDSNRLENLMENKQVSYGVADKDLDALLTEAYERPFTTFKNIIMNAQMPLVSRSEISEINQVDKHAISDLIQTLSESGPSIGAAPVSVDYRNEI